MNLRLSRRARSEATIHDLGLVFWVPRGSHTTGGLLVVLPDDDTLIAGDVLVHGVVPTLQDGFLKNWIGTLDEMLGLPVAHFVPGHGEPMTRHDVVELRDALQRFRAGIKECYRARKSET